MQDQMKSLEASGFNRAARKRIGWRGEIVLITLPTITVLIVMGLVQVLTEQRLLFASLASSAFLIYLDPQHGTNAIKTLMLSQIAAATLGWFAFLGLGAGYGAAASAMVATIAVMAAADAIHPPAVATSLSFALRAGDASNFLLFGLAVGITAVLVVLETSTLWFLARYTHSTDTNPDDRSSPTTP